MLETDRLLIRKMRREDYHSLHNVLSNPSTMKFWPAPFNSEQTEQWLNRNIENYRKYGFGRWVIQLKENNEIIGDCGFFVIEIDGKIENDIGYIIHSDYWNNGYGTEAAKACLESGFNRFGMRRIVANMPYNHFSSIRVAEKIGMRKEKEFINNKNRNILTYLYSKEV